MNIFVKELENMNKKEILELIENKYLEVNKHPNFDLYIYNYSAKAQYDRLWNEITLQCRGLIMDSNFNVIARPFLKFFNLGEMENQVIPNLPFDVFDKLDGSLGILYFADNKPFIATRGSFTSDQAIKANELLNSKYKNSISKLNPDYTYLFEIIYPTNRIVVDYGTQELLVLTGIIETKTGNEIELIDIGFPIVKKYDSLNDISKLNDLEQNNKEGFVIKFSNNYRLKVKFEEYKRIHKIVTQVSSIAIWEYLRENSSLNELLEKVPDEFYDWVKKIEKELKTQFDTIENQCKKDFKILEDRKQTALYFQKCENQSVLFAMLNERNYADIIWKKIRPEHEKPFSNSRNLEKE